MWKGISEFGGYEGRYVVLANHPDYGAVQEFAYWCAVDGWVDLSDDCEPIELDGWVVTKWLDIPDPE